MLINNTRLTDTIIQKILDNCTFENCTLIDVEMSRQDITSFYHRVNDRLQLYVVCDDALKTITVYEA